MVSHRILIVEGDPELRAVLATAIREAGGAAPLDASTEDEVVERVRDGEPEAILVDLDWINCRERMALLEGVKANASTHAIRLVPYHSPFHQRADIARHGELS